MRKILIVGAGQSGLHLAHGLLTHGYDVTLITGQSSTEIRTGRPSVTQLTYPTVLGYEQELDLDFWSSQAPHIEMMKIHVWPSGTPEPFYMPGHFDGYAISVDRRVKMADWLEHFEDRGGKVVIHGITITDLDYLARMYDLVVIAVGHGELGALFDTDSRRFSSARSRTLVQALVDGVTPEPGESENVGFMAGIEDAGMLSLVPFLSTQGPCHSLFIVDHHNGPLSTWPARMPPQQQWQQMQELLRDRVPQYYERCKDATLVDGASTLVETVVPQVRNPVGTLPSGGQVLGIADVVLTSDPFAVQGWNNSTHCARSYLHSILERGEEPFDAAFMTEMFERFWTYGHPTEQFAQMLSSFWEEEQPSHYHELFTAAATYAEVGDRFVQSLDHPPSYQDWYFDAEGARSYLAEVTARHGG